MPPQREVPWTLTDVALGIALVLAFVLGLILFGSIVIGALGIGNGVITLVLSLVLEGVLLLAVALLGPWKYGRSWDALGIRGGPFRRLPRGAITFLAIFGFTVIYGILVSALDLEFLEPPGLPEEVTQNLATRVLGFMVAVVAAPFAEEVFFRGFMLPVLVARLGFIKGAALVSLLFAFGHLSVGLLIPAFVSGMILAYAFYRTRSLWVTWAAHTMQNTLAYAVTVAAMQV